MSIPRTRPPGRYYDAGRALWRFVFAGTMRVRTHGLENIPDSEGVILAVNHASHLDPVVVSARMQRRVSWMSRVEFYEHWFMRNVLTLTGAFAVNRQGYARPAIREGLSRLARGEAVGLFPEGEVTHGTASVLRGGSVKHGGCLLAARSGCPVVPVVIAGTDTLTRIGPWLPMKRGRLWLSAGPALHAPPEARTRIGRAAFATELEAAFVRQFAELRRQFALPDSIVP